MFRYLLGIILLMASVQLAAEEIDLTLSDNSALFRYIQFSGFDQGQAKIDVGFLYTDQNDFLLMLGFQVEGEAGSGSPGLHVGVGIKGFSASADSFDLLAFALGGELRYTPAALARLSFRITVYHAPEIVTFFDAEDFTYAALSVEYEVLSQAAVYLGYRNVDVGIQDTGNEILDDDVHLGLRLNF